MPIYSTENRKDVLVLLDGDERPSTPLPDPNSIPENEASSLKDALKQVAKVEIKFPVDGGENGGNAEQELKARRAFVKWVRTHVDYLPGNGSPEEYIWNRMPETFRSGEVHGVTPVKKRFEALTRRQLGRQEYEPVTSAEITLTEEQCLAAISDDDDGIECLYKRLHAFAQSSAGTDGE